jgi:predicted porin/outer membrane murein-binding lipoprotein Lpp
MGNPFKRPLASTLGLGIGLSGALLLGTIGSADAQSTSTAAQIKALQEQINQLQQAVNAMKAAQQTAQQAPAPAPAAARAAPATSAGGAHEFFERKPGDALTLYTHGGEITAYGNLDVSVDVATKGIGNKTDSDGVKPRGNVGWQPAISTNLSYFGLRGFQTLGSAPFNLVYQLETQIDISASSGTTETNSNQSNVVKGGLTSRNSFIGLANSSWGAVKIGKTDAPYKSSTARMNPFSAMLGDYQVIMSNTGGDNRVEFGTRLDHSIWYESPSFGGLTFAALFSPGQNRSSNSDNIASGESDCAGGNTPSSGGLVTPACSDGSFSDAVSLSAAYSSGPLYITAGYERHFRVNRSSDIAVGDPTLLAFQQNEDTADEDAAKIALQFAFPTKTTVGGIFESLHRYVPGDLAYQNERQRFGTWLVVSQQLTDAASLHFGWAHAFRTPGDPGQHNTGVNPIPGDPGGGLTGGADPHNEADMLTAALKYQITKDLTAYTDFAMTINGPAAHFDLGAGGRSVTTDCHDATGAAGGVNSTPRCWAGGLLMGVSAGLQYRF